MTTMAGNPYLDIFRGVLDGMAGVGDQGRLVVAWELTDLPDGRVLFNYEVSSGEDE
jgi:hypothetical protein